MNCPCCTNAFSLTLSEGGRGYYCSQCVGVWLSKEALESLFNANKFDVTLFKNRLFEERRFEKSKSCPDCQSFLATSEVNEIELDWCESCDGVWFDQGELCKLTEGRGDFPKPDRVEPAHLGIWLVELIGMVLVSS